MTNRHHIPLALSALALLATPAAAQARQFTMNSYRVDMDVELHTSHTAAHYDSDESHTRAIVTTSKIHSSLPEVIFKDHTPYEAAAFSATAQTSGEAKGTLRNAGQSMSKTCTPKQGTENWGVASLVPEELAPLEPSTAVHLRVADHPDIEWTCNSEGGPQTEPTYFFSDTKPGIGEQPLDANFNIPWEVIGYGKVIQRIQGPPTHFCAGEDEPDTTNCGYSWTGKATFTKTGEWIEDEDGNIVSPGAPPVDAPGTGAPAAASGVSAPAGAAAPTAPVSPSSAGVVAPGAAKADPKGRTVSFTATCPTGCAGSAVLSVPKAHGASAAAAKPLATMRFSLKPGSARLVTLRVPRKAAQALRRAGRGTVAIALRPTGGPLVRRTLAVRVAKKR